MNKKIELSPRLRMVADLVPEGARLADVGTDHAYLPAALLQEGRIPFAIAADLRSGPLSRAKATASAYNLDEKIAFRLCNGLQGIGSEEIDAVVIAGMGGETIADILQAVPWVKEKKIPLILQPMSTMPELRKWLIEHGYCIARELLAQEGDTIYTCFYVQTGEMKALSLGQLWAGENRPDPLRGMWLDRWILKTELALDGLAHSRQKEAGHRCKLLAEIHEELLGMKKEWTSWQ